MVVILGYQKKGIRARPIVRSNYIKLMNHNSEQFLMQQTFFFILKDLEFTTKTSQIQIPI